MSKNLYTRSVPESVKNARGSKNGHSKAAAARLGFRSCKQFSDIPEITARDLAEASASNRRMLYICLQVLVNGTGCNAPGEELIKQLLHIYAWRAISPDDVDEAVAEFKDNFEDVIATTARAVEAFPQLVAKQLAPGSFEQIGRMVEVAPRRHQ